MEHNLKIRLKELRTEKGLKQIDLAKKLNTTQSTIGKYERGELEPSIETLKMLSAIFECSIDYILGNSDDEGKIVLKQEKPLTKEEALLLQYFNKLKYTQKIEIITLLQKKQDSKK